MKRISINILNYNSYHKTKKCIKSCILQENIFFDIYLIDNMSTDGSFELLKNEFGSKLNYIENSDNFGYAKANNIAINKCIGLGYDYSFILNCDTELRTPYVLEKLISILETQKNCVMIAPTVFDVQTKGIVKTTNDSGYLKFLRIVSILPKKEMITESIEKVNELQGSAILVDNNKFVQVGGFPEHYYMYGEESTLAKKLQWSGGELLLYHDDENCVYHYHDTSYQQEHWRYYLMGRNFALEYYTFKEKWSIRWTIIYYIFLIHRYFKAKNSKKYQYLFDGMLTAKRMIDKQCKLEDYYLDGKMAREKIK